MITKGILMIGILALASVAAASTEQRYVGIAEQGNWVIRVDIALRDSQHNDGIVRFDSPANCGIPIKFLKAEGGERTYRFMVSPNGGAFCDRLTGGSFVLKESDDKTHFRFSDPRKNVPWTGKAEKR